MTNRLLKPLLLCLAILHLSDHNNPVAAHGDAGPIRSSVNTAGDPIRTLININRIGSWYEADGTEEITSTGQAGLKYPKGTAGAIFTSGLLWSGLHFDGMDPLIRTNGHSYATGLQPGAILGERTGIVEDRSAPDVRIWRVRRDFAAADLKEDAAGMLGISEENVTEEQIEEVRSQYWRDWLGWPTHKGAPFYDADGDGVYEPVVLSGVPVFYPGADEPGIADADQVIWYAANDLKEEGSPWGGVKTGIEVQQTIWAFDRADGLGDAVFKRYRLIYKGMQGTADTARIDSMYIGIWSDPDLGAFANDFAGCDSLLQLGYCYNGAPVDEHYAAYGLSPPAIGYVMLQGPLLSGIAGEDRNRNAVDDMDDTGVFDMKPTKRGFVNLPLTSFVYEAAGGLIADPPFNLQGGLQRYCELQGFPPTPQPPPCPAPTTDPWTGQPAPKFWLYGDPRTRQGWVDGLIEAPGDRRFIMGTGPFTLALGDTQEIVVAVVGGLGNDYLNSITRLQSNARLAQIIHQELLDLPGPPAKPGVRAIGFDREVLLDWESDDDAVRTTEDSVITGRYEFEGYKVYQYPDETADSSEAILIAQFDLVNGVTSISQLMPDPVTGELFPRNVQYGTDNGITRTLAVSADRFRDSTALVNGREYYFGIAAYNYTQDSLLQVRTYESEPTLVTVQPETPKPGTRYPYSIGDTIATVTQIVGSSEGVILPVVYNPEKQTGETYRVRIDTTASGTLAWTLTNHTKGTIIYSLIEDFSGDTTYRVQESGFDISVATSETGVTSVVNQDSIELFGTLAQSSDGTLSGFGGLAIESGEDYEIRFGEASYVLNRGNPTFLSAVVSAPFTLYELGPGDSPDTPVMAVIHDRNGTPEWDLVPDGIEVGDTIVQAFEAISGTTFRSVPDDPLTPVREDSVAVRQKWTSLISATQYSYHHSAQAFSSLFLVDSTMTGIPPTDGSVRIVKHHAIRSGDEFEINLGSVTTGDVQVAKADVTLINVFPNPYYGLNADETSTSGRFITFNHLPAKAVIRIFNLAGIRVRKLEKDDAQTQYYRWDLRNEHNNLVGSGIYIAYLELADENGVDLGTKTLKLVVIQSNR